MWQILSNLKLWENESLNVEDFNVVPQIVDICLVPFLKPVKDPSQPHTIDLKR